MLLLAVVLSVALLLVVAYRTYGRFLARWMGLDDTRPTPAQTRADGADFVATPPGVVAGQHFTAIAAAGPIVGPILAGLAFGWGPALLWIVLGAILVGGAHDMAALFASVRHGAVSIAEVVRRHLRPTAWRVFLLFIWLALLYIIVAFADLTASTFRRVVEVAPVAAATVSAPGEATAPARIVGGGVATAAVLYLLVSVGLGLAVRYARWGWWQCGLIGVAAVIAGVLFGPSFPLVLPADWSPELASRVWVVGILLYCLAASVLPVWLLLQPRGFLGGLFLYAVVAVGAVGTVWGALSGQLDVRYPAFVGWQGAVGPLWPFLFITIACGACSGFHALVASGTTSKQVATERDIRPIGYGMMLTEAMLATFALATVMILPAGATGSPDAIFAAGLGHFLALFGVPLAAATMFGLLAFSTFIFDTLDVCTRLGRYLLQELTGWHGRGAGFFATVATLAFPTLYLLLAPGDAWRQFWTIFGTSNQLLAALSLVGLSVWFRALGKNPWPVLGPAVFMLAVTGWTLGHNLWSFIQMAAGWAPLGRSLTPTTLWLNLGIAALLAALAVVVVTEAVRIFRTPAASPSPSPTPAAS